MSTMDHEAGVTFSDHPEYIQVNVRVRKDEPYRNAGYIEWGDFFSTERRFTREQLLAIADRMQVDTKE